MFAFSSSVGSTFHWLDSWLAVDLASFSTSLMNRCWVGLLLLACPIRPWASPAEQERHHSRLQAPFCQIWLAPSWFLLQTKCMVLYVTLCYFCTWGEYVIGLVRYLHTVPVCTHIQYIHTYVLYLDYAHTYGHTGSHVRAHIRTYTRLHDT